MFDTQIAAALTSTSQQSSYQFLVGNLLGRSLRKSESFTRWDQRPLTPEQLAYARQDVEHLLPIAAALRERLAADGRLEWAREECRLLETAAAEERDPEEQFRRLAAGRTCQPLEAAVARELVFWREETAREQDRPVRSVIPDRMVTQLARRRPASLDALKQERGVGEGMCAATGTSSSRPCAKASRRPPVKLPPRPEQPPWFAPLTRAVRSARASALRGAAGRKGDRRDARRDRRGRAGGGAGPAGAAQPAADRVAPRGGRRRGAGAAARRALAARRAATATSWSTASRAERDRRPLQATSARPTLSATQAGFSEPSTSTVNRVTTCHQPSPTSSTETTSALRARGCRPAPAPGSAPCSSRS